MSSAFRSLTAAMLSATFLARPAQAAFEVFQPSVTSELRLGIRSTIPLQLVLKQDAPDPDTTLVCEMVLSGDGAHFMGFNDHYEKQTSTPDGTIHVIAANGNMFSHMIQPPKTSLWIPFNDTADEMRKLKTALFDDCREAVYKDRQLLPSGYSPIGSGRSLLKDVAP